MFEKLKRSVRVSDSLYHCQVALYFALENMRFLVHVLLLKCLLVIIISNLPDISRKSPLPGKHRLKLVYTGAPLSPLGSCAYRLSYVDVAISHKLSLRVHTLIVIM